MKDQPYTNESKITLNDLFGIELILLRSELEYCNFLNLYERVLWYESFLTIFSFWMKKIEVRLVTIKNRIFFDVRLYPLSFFASTPFKPI